jgi:ElaB/YqjD/DUF883 family membrane-anchored ribosome-binding protein
MTDTTGGQAGGQGGGQDGGGGGPSLASLQQAAQSAASQLNERTQAARDWASMQTDVARQTVVERPFVSAGAAFAAGVVFGVLLARR